MTADDKTLTEQIQAEFLDEKPWRAAVEAVMRYEGFTDEQIAEADDPVVHTEECADNGFPFGWHCEDEYGVDQHPLHTRSRELDRKYQLFFEESDLAAAVLPIIRKAERDAAREAAQMIRDACDRWEVDGDDERLVNEVLDPWTTRILTTEETP